MEDDAAAADGRGAPQPQAGLPVGPHVYLRHPGPGDAVAFVRAVQASRELHRGWSTPPDTTEAFGTYLERVSGPSASGFLFLRRSDDAILGRATLSQIFRGTFLSTYLGYEAMAGHERQGHTTEGVRLVLHHAFGPLGLHRVEANVQPDNVASIALVRRLGFRREGYSPRYLQIGGEWRDHERWALLQDEFDAGTHTCAAV